MDKRMREAVRYLGYGRNAADDRTIGMITDAFSELEQAVQPRAVSRVFDMSETEDGRIIIGSMEIISNSLGRNLKDCVKAVLFGATLGAGVDRLITRYSLTDMAKAVVLQSCAAALLEEYCDERQAEIGEKLRCENLYMRPRFSPGYGDFDIRHQEELMRMLDCAKTIGLTMTDSFMMSPTKSVTALIGLSPMEQKCPPAGCESCGKTDCIYRR